MTDCYRGLSCEPVQETLSVCEHGVPVKLDCYKCFNENDFYIQSFEFAIRERMDELEKELKRLINNSNTYHLDIHKLHEYNHARKNEINEIERQLNIHGLENKYEPIFTSEMQKDVTHLLNKVNRLEQLNSQHMNRIINLESKTNETNEKLSNLINMPNVAWAKYNKSPHKCPVCDGNGRVHLKEPLKKDNATYFSISCVSCQEKGIIWG